MKRVLVYSHDTFGLGNIRRMLAISEHLLGSIPDVSVLLVTGSPMVHGFRMRPGLDYIKLPCLSRTGRDEYAAKSLGTDIGQLMQLRAGIILAATRDFDPDVVLIDKKPDGVKHELRPTLDHLRSDRPAAKVALVLRDILDAPQSTIASWNERGYHETLRQCFHSVLVLGAADVFDACREYEFPEDVRRKTIYCGYLRREADPMEAAALRTRLLADGERKLVLVTPGGGEDGYHVVQQYIAALDHFDHTETPRSVLVCGPEMPAEQKAQVHAAARRHARLTVLEFTGDLLPYIAASDLVVSMAGYNTICEILSHGKRTIAVPRVRPVTEQLIRAERLSDRGLLTVIHPDELTPERMAAAVRHELAVRRIRHDKGLKHDGLNGVSRWVASCWERAAAQPAAAISRSITWHAQSLMF